VLELTASQPDHAMPQFFVPRCSGDQEAEAFCELLVKTAALEYGPIKALRYYSITYPHRGNSRTATVGQIHAFTGEIVVAILEPERGPFLIYTERPQEPGVRGPLLATPTSADLFDNESHRQNAQRCLALASQLPDGSPKRGFLEMAAGWLRLAQQPEQNVAAEALCESPPTRPTKAKLQRPEHDA
jgi:hypothetical protein